MKQIVIMSFLVLCGFFICSADSNNQNTLPCQDTVKIAHTPDMPENSNPCESPSGRYKQFLLSYRINKETIKDELIFIWDLAPMCKIISIIDALLNVEKIPKK
ncbi:MAG: hypothetical protein PHE29_09910 [Tissierellia bacterium]|nr:hypothetical protein [Tissierellia bacterium]